MAEAVAALRVDGGVHRVVIEGFDEGARAEVDGLAGKRRVIRVHDAVEEAEALPRGDGTDLGCHD